MNSRIRVILASIILGIMAVVLVGESTVFPIADNRVMAGEVISAAMVTLEETATTGLAVTTPTPNTSASLATAGQEVPDTTAVATTSTTTATASETTPAAIATATEIVKKTPKPVVVKKIILSKKTLSIRIGKKQKLNVSFRPKTGLNKIQRKLKWKSSKASIAKVSSNGIVTARHKGTCTITATAESGVKAKCKVTVNPKKYFQSKLASYSTTFSTDTENNRNRKWNMEKACAVLNKMIVKPGEEFSFNDTIGPRSEATGYKVAGAYRDGQSTSEYGGGICQCSSTLYNAILRADLKVIYRRNHSFTVPYVPVGVDATVSYGEVDFQWENDTKWPIKIFAKVTGNTISVILKGTRPKGIKKKVSISTKIIKTVEKPVRYVYGNQYSTQGTIIQSGHTGYTAQSFRTITVNGKVKVKNQLIATSYYNTMPMIIGKKKGK